VNLLLSLRPAALIDLDVTFFVQLAIFLVVLVALRFLVFKPMLALLEARRAETEGKEEIARKEGGEAHELNERYRLAMLDAAAEGLAVRNAHRDGALKTESETLAKARSQWAAWLDEKVSAYRGQVQASRDQAAPVVESLARDLVSSLTGSSSASTEGKR